MVKLRLNAAHLGRVSVRPAHYLRDSRVRSHIATRRGTALPPTLLTLPQLARVIEVEYRTLHNWVTRGLIKPSMQESAGIGIPNLFDEDDAVMAKILGDLRQAGMSLEMVERAAPLMHERRPELLSGSYLLVNGKVEITTDSARAQDAINDDGWTLVYNSDYARRFVREHLAAE